MSTDGRPALHRRAIRRTRWLRVVAVLGFGTLLVLHAPRASAGTLHVDADALPCRDRPRTVARIVQRLADVMADQPDLGLTLRLTAPKTLTLVLTGGDGATQREVSFDPELECSKLPETVSLLMRGWLSRGWRLPPYSPPSPPAAAPVAPAPPLVAAAAPPPPPAPTSALRVVLLGGGFASDRSPWESGVALRAAAECDVFRHLGLSLVGGGDGSAAAPAGDGRIAVSGWNLALAARGILYPVAASRLELLAGAGIEWLETRAEGFVSSNGTRITRPTLLAAARWRQPLFGPIAAIAGAELDLRRPQILYVRNVSQEITLASARYRLLAGLAWELD